MTAADITLLQWIEFTNSCRELDAWLECARSQPESNRKQVLLTNNYAERAFAWAKFFDIAVESIDDAIGHYEVLLQVFETPTSIELPDIKNIKAGQFIDIKQIISATAQTYSQWEHLQYVISIFGNPYNDENAGEDSDAFIAAGLLTMDRCVFALQWFDSLNKYLALHYSLFAESDEVEQPNMRHHMQQWGWVNFLKSIAKTKVFDIAGSGKNSIDCVRLSPLDDVLVWASEEKDYNIASMRDMELQTQKQ